MTRRFLDRFRTGLKHAFAIEDPAEALKPEEIELLDRLAKGIVRRRMTAPAVLFLESVRPLNFIGSQAMTFFMPIVNLVFNTAELEKIAAVLERRKSIPSLIDSIERCERESIEAKQAADKEKREAKNAKREAKNE
ncbi:MAG: hypothetical protein RDV41_03240 [Planctomycetota bacterium]|nr:hypothetical protein [Planctomycetota bacterium]